MTSLDILKVHTDPVKVIHSQTCVIVLVWNQWECDMSDMSHIIMPQFSTRKMAEYMVIGQTCDRRQSVKNEWRNVFLICLEARNDAVYHNCGI